METTVNLVVPVLEKVLKLPMGELDGLEPDRDLRSFGLNSLSALELIVELENELDIMIDDDDLVLDQLSTLEGIGQMLDRYA
ncbi:acyl carrier protein [Paenibacillus sp. P96]|uniref:Acyl carrier protein n=1 Tax=Paenibacillus zeirhizosphaerae TaxID=2987519 RepID=A0ABT9FLU9_9BACL|nr:acyl carrier protein [Paenibacillus sp. P96]MDP4095718.1 acyl carrier protein [Paenibacillus sp. P96]